MSWNTTQKQATEQAEAAAKIAGPGWKTRVWENMGWNWALESPCGRFDVSPSSFDDEFVAFLHAPGDGPGGRWAKRGKTVAEACQNTLRAAREDVMESISIVGGIAP